MPETEVVRLIRELFVNGHIFFCRRTDCVTQDVTYEVQDEHCQILFEVTQKWFDGVNAAHQKTIEQTLLCGCKTDVIIPNGINTNDIVAILRLN